MIQEGGRGGGGYDTVLKFINNVSNMCFAYRYKPSIATNFVESSLAFDSTEECVQFLQVIGIQFIGDEIDCKASTVNPVAWQNFKFERDKGSLL